MVATGVFVASTAGGIAGCDSQPSSTQEQPTRSVPTAQHFDQGETLLSDVPTACAALGPQGLTFDNVQISPGYNGVPTNGVVVLVDNTKTPVSITANSPKGMSCEKLAAGVDTNSEARDLAATVYPGVQPVFIVTASPTLPTNNSPVTQ